MAVKMDLCDTELIWLVTWWLSKAVGFHDNWNDREWNRNTVAINAASSIILGVGVQCVSVDDHVSMRCWWKVSELEHLFFGSWHIYFLCWGFKESSVVIFDDSLLSWVSIILDFCKIKTHLFNNRFRMTSCNSGSILIFKNIKGLCMGSISVANM